METITSRQIVDYIDKVDKILFVDEDEIRGIGTLYENLLGVEWQEEKCTTYKEFVPPNDYLAISLRLRFLNENGVHVFVFHFAENRNKYLEKFNRMISKKYEKAGLEKDNILPSKMKKEFFGEIYNEEYEKQQFLYNYPTRQNGIVTVLKDLNKPLFHACDGERITVGQPDIYERCVYMYGPCVVLGAYVEDKHTIPSYLQNKINSSGVACKVINKGIYSFALMELNKILSTPLKKGDIVVLYMNNWKFEGVSNIDMVNALEKNKVSEKWVVNHYIHCNYIVNSFYADEIYERLFPTLQQTINSRELIEKEEAGIQLYLEQYFSDFDVSSYETIGAIVMNCNPFTLGHRYLIEEALKVVEYLIVFVVEEDRSLFSFTERFAMVCGGVNDLKNVKVVPSGELILSYITFPEYFVKVADEDIIENIENDVSIFAEWIAPKLNITYRFVGEELEDKITNAYNSAMKRILPSHGIQLVEIPRKRNGEKVISASFVRRCLEINEKTKLKDLVPKSTAEILYFMND